MTNTKNPGNRGGDHAPHERHAKTGQPSPKKQDQDMTRQAGSGGQRGESQEQHVKAGEQSPKNR